jgi:hypothetical protein
LKILKAADECQKEMLKQGPQLAKAVIRIETLHVTLMAMYLKDQNRINLLEMIFVKSAARGSSF